MTLYFINHKGLSTIVGGLLFTILMIAGFSVISLALEAQTDIVNTQRLMSDVELKKQQENFGVVVYTDAGNNLQVSVNNAGQNSVEISSIWLVNKTLTEQPATRYAVNPDDAVISPGFTSEIIGSQNLNIVPDTYDVKIVSTLGTIKVIEFTNGGAGASSGSLRAELITDPPDVIIGQNVTVAMIVTNTGKELIENIEPEMQSVGGSGSIASSSPHIPATVDLDVGESVMFTWDYQVTGNSGDNLIFSALARGDLEIPDYVASNLVSDVSILREPTDGGSGSGTVPDIVNDELLARPQIYLVIPSSQGKSSDDQAIWGINVVNPVNAAMKVSKIIITAFAPGANNNDKLFDGSCNINPISPITGPDSDWSCPSENAIMWKTSSSVTIPANSTRSFMIKIEPGKPSGSNSLESIIVQGSVFTDFGSFGKSGYQSTMSGTTSSLVNVYLTDDALNPRDDDSIQSIRTGIVPDSVQTFDVVFADMDFSGSTTVTSGAQLIINVPKDWTDVTIIGDDGFIETPSVTQFADNSHQIVGITSNSLGSNSNPTDRISFTARAPNISEDKLYVMYVLGQGTTSSDFSIGPLAEIILQVDAS